MRVKMSKQPPPAPTASAVGPCPTVIQIVGRPGTGSLPSTIAPPDHPSDRPDMTLDVYRGRKTTMQQQLKAFLNIHVIDIFTTY